MFLDTYGDNSESIAFNGAMAALLLRTTDLVLLAKAHPGTPVLNLCL